MIHSLPFHLVLLFFSLLCGTGVSYGHSGQLLFQQPTSAYRITVMANPTPLAAGPVEFHILIQEADLHQAVLDAQVSLRLTRLGTQPPTAEETWQTSCQCHTQDDGNARSRNVIAIRDDQRNLLFYTARVDVPSAGQWQLDVEVHHSEKKVVVARTIQIAKPISSVDQYWTWWALTPLGIGLFVTHQFLREREKA